MHTFQWICYYTYTEFLYKVTPFFRHIITYDLTEVICGHGSSAFFDGRKTGRRERKKRIERKKKQSLVREVT